MGSDRQWRWLVVSTIAAMFAIGASVLSWDNAHVRDVQPRFHWPDENANWMFASRVAQGEPLAVPEPRNVAAGNLIHPRSVNVRADGALVPGSYLGLPLAYGWVGRVLGARAMLFVTPFSAAALLIALALLIARAWGWGIALASTVLLAFHPALWMFAATALLPNVPFVALVVCGLAVLTIPSSRGDLCKTLLFRHCEESAHADPSSASGQAPQSHAPQRIVRGEIASRTRNDDFCRGLRGVSDSRVHKKQQLLVVSRDEAGEAMSNPRDRRTLGSHPRVSRVLGVRFFAPLRAALLEMTIGKWLLGGALIGLALTIRTHEFLWVAAIAGAMAWRVRPGWRALLAGALGAVLPFIPILIFNAQLYGSPFTTGYALLQNDGALPLEFAAGGGVFGIARAFIAPFGWHPAEALTRFWEYMVVPYPWFVALAGVGLLHGVAATRSTRGLAQGRLFRSPSPHGLPFRNGDLKVAATGSIAVGTLGCTVWLILYYGSWTLADPLVRETNVLTISYARYWLPIIVLLAPWAAMGFRWLARCAGRWSHALAVLLLLGIALTSARPVIRDPLEGLARQRQAIAEHRERARAVIAATPDDAVIVSHRMDKVFFPERLVIHAPEVLDADFAQHLDALLRIAPVFWYASGMPDIEHATLEPVGTMPFHERLYRVRPL